LVQDLGFLVRFFQILGSGFFGLVFRFGFLVRFFQILGSGFFGQVFGSSSWFKHLESQVNLMNSIKQKASRTLNVQKVTVDPNDTKKPRKLCTT
jgi:hypothetical protein